MLTPDGNLSSVGQTRIRNALFARAYGDATALSRLAEDPDALMDDHIPPVSIVSEGYHTH